jgi:hypothetical protein
MQISIEQECSKQIEHLRMLLQLGISYDFRDKLEAGFCSTQYNIDGVCHNQCCKS